MSISSRAEIRIAFPGDKMVAGVPANCVCFLRLGSKISGRSNIRVRASQDFKGSFIVDNNFVTIEKRKVGEADVLFENLPAGNHVIPIELNIPNLSSTVGVRKYGVTSSLTIEVFFYIDGEKNPAAKYGTSVKVYANPGALANSAPKEQSEVLYKKGWFNSIEKDPLKISMRLNSNIIKPDEKFIVEYSIENTTKKTETDMKLKLRSRPVFSRNYQLARELYDTINLPAVPAGHTSKGLLEVAPPANFDLIETDDFQRHLQLKLTSGNQSGGVKLLVYVENPSFPGVETLIPPFPNWITPIEHGNQKMTIEMKKP